jgi:hypothetical protein
VQEQINSSDEPIVGYLGHISPDKDPYDFPDIQLQWVKSKLQVSSDKVKLLAKAYVLPGTKARNYLKRRLVRTVSWRGKCIERPMKGGVEVRDFELESIDLSRPRRAGMQAAMAGGLTSEMEGRKDVKPDEIGALQENELRAHNPTLVTAIEDAAKKPLQEKVSEMETAAEAAKPDLELIPEIRKLLGMKEDDDVLDVIGNTLAKLKESGAAARDAILQSVLNKKFKDENTAKLVKKVIAGEMDGFEISGDKEKDEKEIDTKVNELVNADDDLKAMVSEMEDGDGKGKGESGSFEREDRRTKDREVKDGYENSRMTVVKARR